jgi:hypothetical protein
MLEHPPPMLALAHVDGPLGPAVDTHQRGPRRRPLGEPSRPRQVQFTPVALETHEGAGHVAS